MSYFQPYIDKNFSDELKLLVYLSKDELKEKITFSLNDIDWNTFVENAIRHRLVSHILKHTDFVEKHFPVQIHKKLLRLRLDQSKKSLNFAIHIIRINQKFNEQNIAHCFFKGALFSLELYSDVGFRNFKDLDVLVAQKDVEQARAIIEQLDFQCIYPGINLTEKQKKINYKLSHHYHFIHPSQGVEIELHWNITNPRSYFGKNTEHIIADSRHMMVSSYPVPYISAIDNLVFQAAHGSIHQWYRLFWLKDFSVLLNRTSSEDFKKAVEVSKTLKLSRSFRQACFLSSLIYRTGLTNIPLKQPSVYLMKVPLKSISTTDLSQQGIKGKLKLVYYRLKLKPGLTYHFNLLYRLRTHLTDWEIIRINDNFFFLYYLLRPFLLLYKFLFKKRS